MTLALLFVRSDTRRFAPYQEHYARQHTENIYARATIEDGGYDQQTTREGRLSDAPVHVVIASASKQFRVLLVVVIMVLLVAW